MLILVDSREQKPYWKGSQCAKTALIVGDYATYDSLNKFHIERKSLQDLYGTITKGHLRFKKEIERARHNKIRLEVVVEGTKKQFENKDWSGGSSRLVKGETLVKIINSISKNHKLKIHWCSTRSSAKAKTFKLLKLWNK